MSDERSQRVGGLLLVQRQELELTSLAEMEALAQFEQPLAMWDGFPLEFQLTSPDAALGVLAQTAQPLAM